ncbi:UV DNA damage repair endonuclease UvsE [Oculatella sp. LEGE 06141]|uniref:UV DNA damage repair endonuclease UvsE n=1 Tax=Oculatella sp. LEGE 06141 TaxID=1828648 RepID=UPI001883071C|nr:UV DNA damage repair endonuclease UvsE [Oculatella sp. LEGE 06141]MBE9180436.1 UV DNA damage repair endonuclease UvsE [Oculatella sp. LEGE 06141]
MKPLPELGLVCISASNQVRYKTTTRKRLLSLEPAEQQRVLRHLYAENLRRLRIAIDFCQAHQIRLYRMPSNLFPFADDALGEDVLTEFADDMRQVGDRALALGMRLVLHPDQFVVLNSDRPDVVTNSIKILATHARVMDLLGLPRSPWALMNIHGGKGGRSERLISVIRDLPDPIRLRLTLENDEYTYGAESILEICRAAGVPMVFDAHHHVIHAQVDSYEHPSVATYLAAARTTWENSEWQLVHISNGESAFHDQKHSGLIFAMPSAYRDVAWIEIEAKLKEEAIAKLQQEWLPTLLRSGEQPQMQAVQPAI